MLSESSCYEEHREVACLKDIRLLDCTLRDGGYVNGWNFGRSYIQYMLQRLLLAKVDIIEVGFINENNEFDYNRSVFPDAISTNVTLEKYDKGETMFFAMIDYGTCNIDKIHRKEFTFLDGIRVIFKKNNMLNALEYGRKLQEKGYLVALQMVSITSYSDKDILIFCEGVNKIKPYAIGIVDTYGLMHKEQAKHYFDLLDHNLDREIAIGYHSHNNFQLAYANSVEILSMRTVRDLILDGSSYGMGKSAGNAPTELLAMYLNDSYGKQYDIDQILEMIDVCVLPIYERKKWGYNLLFYLAASNDCHPNYLEYLLAKKTLSVNAINKIISGIDEEKKLAYDVKHIEKLYLEFQANYIDDKKSVAALKEKYGSGEVLLLGPGGSISQKQQEIQAYIDNCNPQIIAVNFIPEGFDIDGIFIGSSKRYGTLVYQLEHIKAGTDIIITSNIDNIEHIAEYVLNIERLLDEREAIKDISTAMVLNLLIELKVNSISLAGFDGFGDYERNLYCDECTPLNTAHSDGEKVNAAMCEKMADISRKVQIKFLTPSKYEVKT